MAEKTKPARYSDFVFLNVPFDKKYRRLLDALVFAVHDCGYIARSAQEVEDSGEVRVEKIYRLISECRYGIHDISRAGVDRSTGLARFNMPLELGLFLGARKFGSALDRTKRSLVLDRAPYRYQKFCSDIAGQDIRSHADDPSRAIRGVRDWLSNFSP